MAVGSHMGSRRSNAKGVAEKRVALLDSGSLALTNLLDQGGRGFWSSMGRYLSRCSSSPQAYTSRVSVS